MRRWISLFLVLGFATPALAQHGKEFEEHKKKATIHYELAEYDKAIEEYKAAYAISQESWILYNIAQAYRLAGNCALAARFYKNYVTAVAKGKDPAPERTKHAHEQLPKMEKCAAEQPSPANATPTTPPSPPEEVKKDPSNTALPEPTPEEPGDPGPTIEPTAGEDKPAPGRWKRITGLSLVGGGAVLVGAGIVFNLQALDKEKALEERFSSMQPETWDAEAQALQDDMDTLKTRAVVFYVIGGACLAAGGVLSYLGFTETSSETVAVTPLPGGGMIATSFQF